MRLSLIFLALCLWLPGLADVNPLRGHTLSTVPPVNHLRPPPRPTAKPAVPQVVILSYGARNGDGFTSDPGGRLSARYERCGIQPVTMHDVPTASLGPTFRANGIGNEPLVLLNAHAKDPLKEAGKFVVGSNYSAVPAQSGDELVTQIHAASPGAQVWLGTCHALACRATSGCIGGECRANEVTYPERIGWQKLADLVCSGYSESCALWNKYDSNHDGDLTSAEMNAYLPFDRAFFFSGEILGDTPEELNRGLEKFGKACAKERNGNVVPFAAKKRWKYSYDVETSPGTLWSAAKTEKQTGYHTGSAEFVGAYLKSKTNKPVHLTPAGWAVEARCDHEKSTPGILDKPSGTTSTPQAVSLTLHSIRCKEEWESKNQSSAAAPETKRQTPAAN